MTELREMTPKEYFRFILRKELEAEAAKHGIKVVEKKSKPHLVTDNVVKFETKEQSQ